MFAKLEQAPGWFLETDDEAKNWILEMVAELPLKRQLIEAIDPNHKGSALKAQQASQAFLMAAGSVQGAIAAMHKARRIPTALADELQLRVLAALVAKVQEIPVPIVTP